MVYLVSENDIGKIGQFQLNMSFFKTFSNTLYRNSSFWKQTMDLLAYQNLPGKTTTDFENFFT